MLEKESMVVVVEGTDGLAGDVGRSCRALLLEKNWRHTTTQWSPHGALGEVVMCPELARVLRPGFPPPGFPPPAAGLEAF